jgi:hypothetical protein
MRTLNLNMYDDVGAMWRKEAMACFKSTIHHLPEVTEEIKHLG